MPARRGRPWAGSGLRVKTDRCDQACCRAARTRDLRGPLNGHRARPANSSGCCCHHDPPPPPPPPPPEEPPEKPLPDEPPPDPVLAIMLLVVAAKWCMDENQ